MKKFDLVKQRDENGKDEITVARTKGKRLDIGARIVCLLIALVIWIYMVNVHDTGTHDTLTLKIDVIGETALSSNDDMMIYAMNKKTVEVTVKGTNRDLKEYLDKEYRATIDVSKISTTGEHILDIVIKTPENSTITFVSAEPATVSLWSDYRVTKDIPLEAVVIGADNQINYYAVPSCATVTVSGPKAVIERISVAVIEVGGKLYEGAVKEDSALKFYDAIHKEIDSKEAISYISEGIFVTVHEKTVENETE